MGQELGVSFSSSIETSVMLSVDQRVQRQQQHDLERGFKPASQHHQASSHAQPLAMAEPMHRLAPKGASTGQSVRVFKKSYIKSVKDTCLFYVKKCSGKYTDNQTAARYVHHMAEEVISLLSGVAEDL